MRSDYYVPAPPETPLIPLPPPARTPKKKRNHALPLFLIFIVLLTAGTGGLAWMLRDFDLSDLLPSQRYPFEYLDAEPTAPVETTIQTSDPPGKSALAIQARDGGILPATEIYARVSPAILSVAVRYKAGGGAEGTGVIFESDGYFLTNAHVVVGGDTVSVTLSTGKTYPAFLVGMDEDTDLAVLKFSGRDLPTASFGSDLDLVVGEDVYAIGNPLGSQFRGSITEGILSGIDRSVTVEGHQMSLLQTTAAINSGSSGGALVNTRGQVVGVTNMKMMSWYATVEGLGFAIPSTMVKQVTDDLMRVGYVTGKPVLGITVRTAKVPEECSEAGLYVEEVNPKSDAWAQGLRAGDVLISANGTRLEVNADLLMLRAGLTAGDKITLEWISEKNGAAKTADVALVEKALLE